MPAPNRGHRAQGGMTRTHSRTSSGGSKVGLNLQFTQKDAPPPRLPDKSRKSAHFNHEPITRTSTLSRISSANRLPSREQVAPAQLRRAPPPSTTTRTKDGKHRAGFTISSPSEVDDDEWVSSESGNATPNAVQSDSEGEETKTPIEPSKPQRPPSPTTVNGFHREDVPTPRAEVPPSLPRVASGQIAERIAQPSQRDFPLEQRSAQPSASQSHLAIRDQQTNTIDLLPPPITKARSETHSPPRSASPPPKRQSMTRPPSTHSITSRTDGAPLRPHPLIRGHSYGHGALFAPKPAPLAPLTMVSSDAAQAQLSSASSPSSIRAGSPTSIRTASPNHSSPSSSEARRQLRRTSTSSSRSTATMPVQSASQVQLSRSNHDRQRTLSTISSSSSFAALSSLAMRSTPSPPRESTHFTSHFPPAEQLQNLEVVHPLLPPPYLNAHMSVLTYRNPVAESYDRIMRAKQAR